MRIDLPCCGFKNCRHCFDGNCMKPSEQGKCEYWYILHEEPERKKGKWIELPNHMAYKCSECGRIIQTTDGRRNVSKHYPFCHCGADMREGDSE